MSLIQYDTLDDRREIHRLLQLLHPHAAIRWLDRLCAKCVFNGTRPSPARTMAKRVEDAIIFGGERHFRLATELYFDVMMMASQFGLDLGPPTRELEELVRRQR
jgi:hypothetical protein